MVALCMHECVSVSLGEEKWKKKKSLCGVMFDRFYNLF